MKYQISNPCLKFCYFLLLVCVFTFLYLIFDLPRANAQIISLRSYPSLIQIQSPTAQQLSSNIAVENLSTDPVSLQIQIKLFKASDKSNGEIQYLAQNVNPNQILGKIHVFDGGNKITGLNLGPQQQKELTVKIDLTNTDLGQDYYFSVIFLTNKPAYQPQKIGSNLSSYSTINAGVASNVLVSTGEQAENSAGIEKFSTSTYLNQGPVGFTLKAYNNGSNYIQAQGAISIKNMFGQVVGDIEIPPTIVLASSKRYLRSKLSTDQTQSSDLPQVVWDKKFLLGVYEAKLNMQFSDKSPVITRTVRFFAFPYQFILLFIVLITFSVIIVKRVREKMRIK